MSRKQLLLVFLGLTLLAGGCLWLLWPWAGVTEANFARIRDDMHRAEVESILGRPTQMSRPDVPILFAHHGGLFRNWGKWGDDARGRIHVSFDEQWRVKVCYWEQPPPPPPQDRPPTFLEQVRDWFRR
jgi:hypothetical protein